MIGLPRAAALEGEIFSFNKDTARAGDELRDLVVEIEMLRLGVTLKSVTLGNVTMSHRTRERPPNALRLSHSTMIGLPRAC
ncbi:hypothetical protein EVAR_28915_1 [Eumeta japonica]|uniref:Uncharacterized protein n=1 Tax=Eumeta variegata TaxID=151549 RepID=A0A4C1YPG8_EUMVA|nr:hypothetical protein EVAR_28915_1 [Eumeta japonica]